MATNKLQFDITAKDRTKRAFGTIKKGLGGIAKAVLNFKTALVGVVGVAGIGLLIKNTMQGIDKIGKLSRQLFISTENLGAFQLAADLGGTSLDAFAKGVRTMGVGINDWLVKGTGIAKEAFEQLNITQDQVRATNGDLFAQFELVADALNGLEGNVDKTAIAYKLFGGRNIELLTAIEGGSAGIQKIREEAERFGLTLSSEVVSKVEQANDSITKMRFRFIGLTRQMVANLAPAFLDITEKLGAMFDGFIESRGGVQSFSKIMIDKLFGAIEAMVMMLGNMILGLQRFFGALRSALEWTGIFDDGLEKMTSRMAQNSDQIEILTGLMKILENQGQKSSVAYKEHEKTVTALTVENAELLRSINNLNIGMSINQMEGKGTKEVFEDLLEVMAKWRATLTATEKQTEKNTAAHKKYQEVMSGDGHIGEEIFNKEKEKLQNLEAIYAKYYKFQQIEAQKTKLAKMKMQDEWQDHMQTTTMSALQQAGQLNKKAFEAYQRFAIGKAIMDTYSAALAAFAKFGGWPLGAMAATATIAQGMAQVAIIKNQSYTGRAMGGPVSAGQPYMVGEQGREMFVPNQDGSIVSNGDLGRNINIVFRIETVDAGGFDQLLSQRRSMIVNMINSAVNEQGKGALV